MTTEAREDDHVARVEDHTNGHTEADNQGEGVGHGTNDPRKGHETDASTPSPTRTPTSSYEEDQRSTASNNSKRSFFGLGSSSSKEPGTPKKRESPIRALFRRGGKKRTDSDNSPQPATEETTRVPSLGKNAASTRSSPGSKMTLTHTEDEDDITLNTLDKPLPSPAPERPSEMYVSPASTSDQAEPVHAPEAVQKAVDATPAPLGRPQYAPSPYDALSTDESGEVELAEHPSFSEFNDTVDSRFNETMEQPSFTSDEGTFVSAYQSDLSPRTDDEDTPPLEPLVEVDKETDSHITADPTAIPSMEAGVNDSDVLRLEQRTSPSVQEDLTQPGAQEDSAAVQVINATQDPSGAVVASVSVVLDNDPLGAELATSKADAAVAEESSPVKEPKDELTYLLDITTDTSLMGENVGYEAAALEHEPVAATTGSSAALTIEDRSAAETSEGFREGPKDESMLFVDLNMSQMSEVDVLNASLASLEAERARLTERLEAELEKERAPVTAVVEKDDNTAAPSEDMTTGAGRDFERHGSIRHRLAEDADAGLATEKPKEPEASSILGNAVSPVAGVEDVSLEPSDSDLKELPESSDTVAASQEPEPETASLVLSETEAAYNESRRSVVEEADEPTPEEASSAPRDVLAMASMVPDTDNVARTHSAVKSVVEMPQESYATRSNVATDLDQSTAAESSDSVTVENEKSQETPDQDKSDLQFDMSMQELEDEIKGGSTPQSRVAEPENIAQDELALSAVGVTLLPAADPDADTSTAFRSISPINTPQSNPKANDFTAPPSEDRSTHRPVDESPVPPTNVTMDQSTEESTAAAALSKTDEAVSSPNASHEHGVVENQSSVDAGGHASLSDIDEPFATSEPVALHAEDKVQASPNVELSLTSLNKSEDSAPPNVPTLTDVTTSPADGQPRFPEGPGNDGTIPDEQGVTDQLERAIVRRETEDGPVGWCCGVADACNSPATKEFRALEKEESVSRTKAQNSVNITEFSQADKEPAAAETANSQPELRKSLPAVLPTRNGDQPTMDTPLLQTDDVSPVGIIPEQICGDVLDAVSELGEPTLAPAQPSVDSPLSNVSSSAPNTPKSDLMAELRRAMEGKRTPSEEVEKTMVEEHRSPEQSSTSSRNVLREELHTKISLRSVKSLNATDPSAKTNAIPSQKPPRPVVETDRKQALPSHSGTISPVPTGIHTPRSAMSEITMSVMSNEDAEECCAEAAEARSPPGKHQIVKQEPAFERRPIPQIIMKDLWSTQEDLVESGLQQITIDAFYDDDARSVIARTGGILSIVRCMDMHRDSVKIQVAACQALEKLALDHDNELAINDVGGVESILNAMIGHLDCASVQEAAWAALWNLSCGNAGKNLSLDSSGGIEAIVSAMKRHEKEPDVQKNACGALANLCLDNETRLTNLVKAGGLSAIAGALESHWENPEVRTEASHALTQILEDPRRQDSFEDVEVASTNN